MLPNNGNDVHGHITGGVQRMLRFAKHSLSATGFADEAMVRQKVITRTQPYASILPYFVSSILDQPTQAIWYWGR